MGKMVCPECKSKKVVMDSEKGELVCKNCGLIMEQDAIDMGKEWRSFDSDQFEERARTGSPMKYVKLNKGLVTMIDRRGTDLRGNKLSSKSRA
ncbi:MAG: TFIIB-type zinc ribbon-containing protein, partial [archaeon]